MALPETARDQLETTFTPMLRRAYDAIPTALAFALVDQEGECIDYVAGIDSYDAKVSAAHAFVMLHQVCSGASKLGLVEPFSLEVTSDLRTLWARRMSDEYVAVAVVTPEVDRSKLEIALQELSREFRSETGIEAPSWDRTRGLEVLVRSAVGWAYAPTAFSEGGIRVAVSDVIGRWTEPSEAPDGDDVVCFRVRTQDGQELTLVHDPGGDGWLVRA